MISSTDTDSWPLSLLDEPPQVQEKTIARNTVDMYLEKYPTRTVKPSDICTNIPELMSEKERSVYSETANDRVGKLVWEPNVIEYDVAKNLFQKLKKKYGTAVHEEKVIKLLHKFTGDTALTKKYVKNNTEEAFFSGRGDTWSELEKDLFEVGMKHFGKHWRKMHDLIKSKTIEEIATYYYWWKLTIRSEVFYEKLYQENFREENKQFIANPNSIFMERLKRAGKRPPLDKLCVFLSDSSEYYSEDEIVDYDSEKNHSHQRDDNTHFSIRREDHNDEDNDDDDEEEEEEEEEEEDDDEEEEEEEEEESAEYEHEGKEMPLFNSEHIRHNNFNGIKDTPVQFHNHDSNIKTANNCQEKYNLGDRLNGGHAFDSEHFEIFNENAHPLSFDTFNLDFPINDAAPRSLKNQFPIIDDDHMPPKKKFKMENFERLEH